MENNLTFSKHSFEKLENINKPGACYEIAQSGE